jgi:hypothetical protein
MPREVVLTPIVFASTFSMPTSRPYGRGLGFSVLSFKGSSGKLSSAEKRLRTTSRRVFTFSLVM